MVLISESTIESIVLRRFVRIFFLSPATESTKSSGIKAANDDMKSSKIFNSGYERMHDVDGFIAKDIVETYYRQTTYNVKNPNHLQLSDS